MPGEPQSGTQDESSQHGCGDQHSRQAAADIAPAPRLTLGSPHLLDDPVSQVRGGGGRGVAPPEADAAQCQRQASELLELSLIGRATVHVARRETVSSSGNCRGT